MSENEQETQKKLIQEALFFIERLRAEKAKKYKGIRVVIDKYSSNFIPLLKTHSLFILLLKTHSFSIHIII